VKNIEKMSRRSFLQVSAAIPILRGHGQIKPPLPVPDIALFRHDGASVRLLSQLRGRVSAVQLMFTACKTTCPIQAAIFQRVQNMLPTMGAQGIQLLSLSIDPDSDTPRALSAWLHHFHAGSSWVAAVPVKSSVPTLQDFFQKGGGDTSDHSTQVNIIDREGRLVWRTYELPAAQEIASVLRRV
jgi:protein SCO1/2